MVLSYNDCPFIRKLYQDWYILSFQRSNPLSQKRGSSFGELIITNYDPRPYMTSQMNLFDVLGGSLTGQITISQIIHQGGKQHEIQFEP